MASTLNHLPEPIILREGEGLKLDQTTNSSIGSTNVQVVFNVK